MEVLEVDPFDDEALAAWHATYDAAERHDRPHATPYHLPELRATFRNPGPGLAHALWAVREGSTVVASTYVELPLLVNTT